MDLFTTHKEALIGCIQTVGELFPVTAFNRVHISSLINLIQGANFETGELSGVVTKMTFTRNIDKRYWDEVRREANTVCWNGYEHLRRWREEDGQKREWHDDRVAQELMVLFELPTHLVVMEHLFVHSRMFPGIEVLV